MNLFILTLVIGAFIALVVWQVYRVFHEVPDEDRSYLDRPAYGFQLVWPLIQAVVHHWGPYFSPASLQSAQHRLRTAGKEYSMTAEQFIGGKIVSALLFAIVSYVVFSMLGRSAFVLAIVGGMVGFFYPELWLKEAGDKRRADILQRLPFFLDIITLAVEAGTNLTGGITQAVSKSGDSPLRSELSKVLRDIRAGKGRSQSLRAMADRAHSKALTGVVSSMIQAERTGSSLGPILRSQADQLRTERFLKAEKKAMEAPVKLLGPLVLFIFPTTFLVLGFLVLSKAIQEGIITWGPIIWAYTWPA